MQSVDLTDKHVLFVLLVGLAGLGTVSGKAACVDNEHLTMTVEVGKNNETKDYSCSDLVKAWPHFCDPRVAKTVSVDCCKSCQEPDVDYRCPDKNAVVYYTTRDKQEVKLLCSELEDDVLYTDMCHKIDTRMVCCKTCIKHPCLDDPWKHWTFAVEGVRKKHYCDELVAANECYCAREDIQKACCRSCKNADYEQPECAIYAASGSVEEAEEEAEGWEEGCVDQQGVLNLFELSANLKLQCKHLKLEPFKCYCSFAKDTCCHTCKGVTDLDKSRDCRIGFNIRGKVHKSCAKLIEEWPIYCLHPVFSEVGGVCHKTCARPETREVSLCADHPKQRFKVPTYGIKYCEDVVKINNNYCKVKYVKNKCCYSCEEALCSNKPGSFTVQNLPNKVKMTCHEVAMLVPQMCKRDAGEGFTSYAENCCKACKANEEANAAVTTYDEKDFTATVCSRTSKTVLCDNCHCWELMLKNDKVAEKACCQVKGTLEKCPYTCSHFPNCPKKAKRKIKSNHVEGYDAECG